MARTPRTFEPLDAMVRAALRRELDEAQARELYSRGAEAVTFILTAMARRPAEQDTRIAELQFHARSGSDTAATPSTPSGMIPVYAKPPATMRRKRPGAKGGHMVKVVSWYDNEWGYAGRTVDLIARVAKM